MVTMMTMMTVFLGYGARVYLNHRHHRHGKQKRGLGYTPEMRLWMTKRYACSTLSRPIPTQKPFQPVNSRRLFGQSE